MKNKRFLTVPAACLLGALVFVACDDDLEDDSHYSIPSFLKGNAYEVLQQDGNHTIFLRGIDLIGYKDVVDSQLLTVIAPSDEAFRTCLDKHGYKSIDEWYAADPQYVTQLITYHLLYYAYDWEKMVNFRPKDGDGATDDQREVNAGLYNLYRTRCTPPDTRAFNSSPSVLDSVTVYHLDRMMPVFSSKYFSTIGIDAKSNYEYFFPNSTWTGDSYKPELSGGFNIANASVTDEESVITDNGYLYHVDQVIEPLPTIYEYLKESGRYDTYIRLYDAYVSYALNEVESQNRGYSVYLMEYSGLPNIASEWRTSDYKEFEKNSTGAYSIFAPTDAAIQAMFDNFWSEDGGYGSVDDLDPLIRQLFIRQSYANQDQIAFPSQIETGEVETVYGTPVNVNPADVSERVMCCNGVVYGADNMDVPTIFSSVVGPVFTDRRYLPYLYALNGSDLLLSLASQETRFIALIPDTAQFTAMQMRLQAVLDSYQLQQWNDEAGAYVGVGSSTVGNIANMNTATDVEALATEGVQVIEANAPFNYWYIVDGKITTNALFNEQLNPANTESPFYNFREIPRGESDSWDNGVAYAYDYPGIFMPSESGKSLEYDLCVCQDKNYPYYVFSQLLRTAKLVDSNNKFTGKLTLDVDAPRFIAMIPTNEALKEALTTLPGCSKLKIDDNFKVSGSATQADLTDYLISYFITADRNTFTTYPYVGSTTHGKFTTSGSYGIEIVDDGTALSATFCEQEGNTPEGTSVAVSDTYHYLPFAYNDGCFQLLNGVLK